MRSVLMLIVPMGSLHHVDEGCVADVSEVRKVKLSLCLIIHHAMKTYGGVEV
jgi:hypothetical protein